MKRQTVAAVLGLGIAASQAGHLLAYALRFGLAAEHVQSTGAHAYFPTAAKTVLGLVAFAAVTALLVVAVARMTGMREEKDSAPPYLRLIAVLFTIQLTAFALQEMVESLLGGGSTSVPLVLVWGTIGQLPAAAAAALALRWLLARVRPTLAWLRARYAPATQTIPYSPTLVVWPLAADAATSLDALNESLSRRGPPSF